MRVSSFESGCNCTASTILLLSFVAVVQCVHHADNLSA